MKKVNHKGHIKFPWKRLIIIGIVFIILILIGIFNYQVATLLGILSVVIMLFQWLFPVNLKKDGDAPSTDPTLPTQFKLPNSDQSLSTFATFPQEQITMNHKSSARIFQFNETLTNADEFIGRVRERTTLISRTRVGASTSIIGPRRIGKTWLISYLNLVASKEFDPTLLICSLDATMPTCDTPAKLIGEALKEFGIFVPLNDDINANLVILEKVLKDRNAKGFKSILCIDEFESFCNQIKDLQILVELRALTFHGFGLVLSSRHPLADVVASVLGEESKTSPFFNIFNQITLTPFNIDEAKTFAQIKGSMAKFTNQEQALLLKYGQKGAQEWPPLRLQLVGSMLLEDKNLASKDVSYYQPNDESYWRKFRKRLEEQYRVVVS